MRFEGHKIGSNDENGKNGNNCYQTSAASKIKILLNILVLYLVTTNAAAQFHRRCQILRKTQSKKHR